MSAQEYMNPKVIFPTIICLALLSAPSVLAQANDGAIHGVRIGLPTTVPNNYGDTWVAALADDGNLYTPSDDTLGFDVPDFLSKEQIKLFQSDLLRFSNQLTEDQKNKFRYSPIAFNRVEGDDPLNLRGVTVNRMPAYVAEDGYRAMLDDPSAMGGIDNRTWKSSGCAFIDGALYWVIHRDKLSGKFGSAGVRQIAADSSIIRSTDYGKSWTRSARENFNSPMFPGSSFATPYFIDYGKVRTAVDGADRYVYATSNNGFWDNGDWVILGRVLRARIGLLKGSDWEFFVGGDGLSNASWSHNSSAAKPILEGAGKFGMTGIVYLQARQRYMTISWYYPGGGGYIKGASSTTVWTFYEAPRPWGPWTIVDSHTWSPQGYYSPVVCPKFQTANRVYVITAGDFFNWWDHYHLTVIPIDLR